ncbi:hypothetical protein BU25DRAFT_40168 [Macroventuria anomochaeta]|uniref:Uncharacterized protein n=1 Tax=Macroventuria anomochaeta TaxID=301207 RepID=A0ACB6S3K4_9PLEO|nr:uncharacterized protein BU25DRAFT_40168 [Macroventuria anomochaeta]KAF2628107.1 hypothetical protein BU25DRAFT_40168 [Macroventuria anomochaeta]
MRCLGEGRSLTHQALIAAALWEESVRTQESPPLLSKKRVLRASLCSHLDEPTTTCCHRIPHTPLATMPLTTVRYESIAYCFRRTVGALPVVATLAHLVCCITRPVRTANRLRISTNSTANADICKAWKSSDSRTRPVEDCLQRAVRTMGTESSPVYLTILITALRPRSRPSCSWSSPNQQIAHRNPTYTYL